MPTLIARLFVLVLLVSNIVVTCALWWMVSGGLFMQGTTLGYSISLGRLTGLLAQVVLLLQIVLVARIHWIEEWFGNDKMVTLHRYIGFGILVLFFAHVWFVTIAYSIKQNTTFYAQLITFVDDWDDVRLAAMGVLVFCIVGLTSVKVIRSKMQYETWYLLHLLTYAAFFLVFTHQIETGDVAVGYPLYYWLVLNGAVGLLFVGYRWIMPFLNSRYHRFVVEKVVQEHPLIFSIYLTGRHMEEFVFEGGQYATLRFHARWFFYPHPFSFSQKQNGTQLRFTIKNLGTWTAAMGKIAPGTRVTVGGPYGRFTRNAAKKRKFLLIAGGIGISPIVALAQELTEQYAYPDDVIALYSARTKAELALRDDLLKATRRTFCFTSEPSDQVAIQGVIDEAVFNQYVPDISERDIYICGPLPMMLALRALLIKMGVPKHQIHYEKFAY
jgi:predicted ferric reductase